MCGGLLDIDLDRQMYICPFCGVSFDYEYFREDNVKEIANKSLSRCEFGAAKDAFDFILQKDPHDFQALRGLILCRCKWKNLLPIKTYNQVHLKEDDPYLVSAIENCRPENKEYFLQIREALTILKEFRKKRSDLQKLEDTKASSEQQLERLRLSRYINQNRFSTMVSDYWVRLFSDEPRSAEFAMFIAMLILIAIGYATWALGWLVLIIVAAIIISAIVGYNINKSVTDKALKAAMDPVTKKIEELNDEIKVNRAESEKLKFRYESLTTKIVLNEPRSPVSKDSDVNQEEEEE